MDDAVYWYAMATVLLFFKMLAIAVYQGFHRIGKMILTGWCAMAPQRMK